MTINFSSLIVIDCDTSLFYWPTVIVFEYAPTSVPGTVFPQPSQKSYMWAFLSLQSLHCPNHHFWPLSYCSWLLWYTGFLWVPLNTEVGPDIMVLPTISVPSYFLQEEVDCIPQTPNLWNRHISAFLWVSSMRYKSTFCCELLFLLAIQHFSLRRS